MHGTVNKTISKNRSDIEQKRVSTKNNRPLKVNGKDKQGNPKSMAKIERNKKKAVHAESNGESSTGAQKGTGKEKLDGKKGSAKTLTSNAVVRGADDRNERVSKLGTVKEISKSKPDELVDVSTTRKMRTRSSAKNSFKNNNMAAANVIKKTRSNRKTKSITQKAKGDIEETKKSKRKNGITSNSQDEEPGESRKHSNNGLINKRQQKRKMLDEPEKLRSSPQHSQAASIESPKLNPLELFIGGMPDTGYNQDLHLNPIPEAVAEYPSAAVIQSQTESELGGALMTTEQIEQMQREQTIVNQTLPSTAILPHAQHLDENAPLVTLWIGVFAHSADSVEALDVFNGLHFTTILECEEGGGNAQRFDYAHHRFGTCHVVRLSRRLAKAHHVNPIGRFFSVEVPVARNPDRDTVYHCSLWFPRNYVVPSNQSGLRFPAAMRFVTRALTECDGYPHKTAPNFHRFFRGSHFYHLSSVRGHAPICTFALRQSHLWFPRSFAQEPATKLSGIANESIVNILQRDNVLRVMRRTIDPYVPFMSPRRPHFMENNCEGSRPFRHDNEDLLCSRRAREAIIRVQNEFHEAPLPRRGCILADMPRMPSLLSAKRKELGLLFGVQTTWLTDHLKKCGVPVWPNKSIGINAPTLRRYLARMGAAAALVCAAIEAAAGVGVKLVLPRKSILRVRRLRRKIRTLRRCRRQFFNRDTPEIAASDDSDDDIPRLGLWDALGIDHDGHVVSADSDAEWVKVTGIHRDSAALKTAKEVHFTEEFIAPWNDLHKKEQDFLIDPVWDVVLPWANAPQSDKKQGIVVGNAHSWLEPADVMYLGQKYFLPVGRLGDQLVNEADDSLQSVNLSTLTNCFLKEDSDTDGSCTEQPMPNIQVMAADPEAAGCRKETSPRGEIGGSRRGGGRSGGGSPRKPNNAHEPRAEMGPCGNFVMGGRVRRHIYSGGRRGRGVLPGCGIKRKNKAPRPWNDSYEIVGIDKLARRLRLDILEAYPQLLRVIPPVIVDHSYPGISSVSFIGGTE